MNLAKLIEPMTNPSSGVGGSMKRYFDNVNDDQRVALQFAFYNVLLFVLLGIALCGLFALYNMMYMFLAPLLWAVLVGTVLFPFKRNVALTVKNYLNELNHSNKTLASAILKSPITIFGYISETVYNTMASSDGVIITMLYLLLKILTYERTFVYLISWMGRVYNWLDSFIVFFTKPWVLPLIILYFCAYAAWIYVQEPKQINKKLARTLSLPIWIYLVSYISLYFGMFRACIFGVSTGILAALSAGVVGVEMPSSPVEEPTNQEVDELLQSTKEKLDEEVEKIKEQTKSTETSTVSDAVTGDRLIRIVFGLCALLWIVRHDSALILISIPFLMAFIGKISEHLGINAAVNNSLNTLWDNVYPVVSKIVNITVAGPLRQFVKVLFTSDKMIVTSLHDKMDVLSSIIVMLILGISAIFALTFVGFQIHSETVHLARLTSNVISSRPDWVAAAMNYTEDQLEENNIDIDDYIQKAYEEGRMWISSNVRSLAASKDPSRLDMLEKQVNQVVDQLYNMWENRNNERRDVTEATPRDWLSQLKGVTDITALKDELTLIIKENLDTLMGLAQSIGGILAVNVTFFTSLLTAFAGLILSFGMEILNTFIEIVVFLTMVYYLLSASRDRWLPLQWASEMSATNGLSTDQQQHQFTAAIEHAIFGVFVLSAKMAVFYGLYTYFIHSLFDLNIVFVPSMAASIFAAIPIMPPYIVAIFGIVELYLVRGEGAAALVFALASFAPQMFADATFYQEVKGSHPYVTGLSIIGGMYWLGLQGAIIGPIVLCLCLVLLNVYLQHVKPSALYNSTTPRIEQNNS